MRAARDRQEHAIHGVLWSAKKDEKREAFSRHRQEHAIHGLLWSAKKDERERRFQEVCGGGAGTYVFSRRALGELRRGRADGQLASVSTPCACAIDLRLATENAVSQGR